MSAVKRVGMIEVGSSRKEITAYKNTIYFLEFENRNLLKEIENLKEMKNVLT